MAPYSMGTNEATAFDTMSGRLTAARDDDRIVLDVPAVPAALVSPPLPGLEAALAGGVVSCCFAPAYGIPEAPSPAPRTARSVPGAGTHGDWQEGR